ncbi:MAG TPA: FGGY-family carbohydrate kinase, partial [Anaerolineales bacterium]
MLLLQFNEKLVAGKMTWKLEDILPKVLVAGNAAGVLTEEGAKLLDPTGGLQAGIPLCPPEGDAGTGMVATNSVAERTGNVSAGTSVFAMIVLEKALSKLYPEIDMVTTPTGKPVAMVHSNNCTSDLNAWVDLFLDPAQGDQVRQACRHLARFDPVTAVHWRLTLLAVAAGIIRSFVYHL